MVREIKYCHDLNLENRVQQTAKDYHKTIFTGFMLVQEATESRKWNHKKLYVSSNVYKTLKVIIEPAKGDSRNPKLA